MKSILFICLLFTFNQINFIKCEDEHFGNPPFLQYDPSETRVRFGDIVENLQIIFMHEDINTTISIAKLNYTGNKKPIIGSFTSGSNVTLGVILEYLNTDWLITVTKKQDYDNEAMREYSFSVSIEDDIKLIYLFIENIDNKPPVILADKPICNFNENKLGPTDCTFNVSDRDGWIDEIKYTIIGKKNEGEIFDIEVHPIPTTSYETNIELIVKIELDYETVSLYTFSIEAMDTGNNIGTAPVVFQVMDEPDMPPEWTHIFSTQEFPEKESQIFSVKAQDGDRYLDEEVNYKLDGAPDFFSIDEKTGVIKVEPINRDEVKNELFPFLVVAYEFKNQSSFINSTILMRVTDINDNPPKVSLDSSLLTIPEGIFTNIDRDIIVNDIDLGENAQYSVSLRDADDGKMKWYEAFTIIPNSGYQEGHFTISVLDATKLDYENKDWRNIKLEVFAIEDKTEEKLNSSGVLNIQLLNLNDELPIFTDEAPVVKVLESIKSEELITTVLATDADEDDSVEYSLVGSQQMKIDKINGEIRTVKDNVFDYEQQQEVIVQVKANDVFIDNYTNKTHSTVITLTISVIDVNDETPVIYTPSKNIPIKENSPDGTELLKIQAFDPDTDADLEFRINWSETRATTQGREVDPELYKDCFIITTKYNEVKFKGNATGTISVKEHGGETLDYEKYDYIYLSVEVTDKEQKINDDTASVSIPITIIDENDCEPIFNDVENEFKVKDKEKKNSIIGYVLATDNDGPLYNQISYFISPENNTKPNLVQIHPSRGEITVVNDNVIDCDLNDNKEYTTYLYYTIIATDCKNNLEFAEEKCYRTPLNIRIFIEDINDQTPLANITDDVVIVVPEDAETGYLIYNIEAFDKDRDIPYHTINYQINTIEHPELKLFFNVDKDNGTVYVDLKDENLDRDKGTTSYMIFIKLRDNANGLGDSKESTLSFEVVLSDVNDNAPEFVKPFIFPNANENITKDFTVGTVEAFDIDEPNTINSTVSYNLLKVWKSTDNNSDYSDYFTIKTESEKGSVITKDSLRGLYGKFYFLVEAQDQGLPPQRNTAEYELEVSKINYEKPQIIFPRENEPLCLSQIQDLNRPLITIESEQLENFKASDEHDGDKWDIDFLLDSDTFNLKSINGNTTQLQLIKTQTEEEYFLTLITRINAIPVSEDSMPLQIFFIDINSYPTFSVTEYPMSFHENSTGLQEQYDIPEAKDKMNKTCNPNPKPVYYFITDEDTMFTLLNNTSRTLKVLHELDREDVDHYFVTIVTTNENKIPINPQPDTTLIVNVKVLDVNDNPPNFISTMVKGLTTTDKQGDVLLTLEAEDLDENESLTYYITSDIEPNGNNIENIAKDGFILNEISGQITLNFQVRSDMSGYFTFTVEVRDKEYENESEGHFDRSSVKIYIITDTNRVVFEFENDINTIQEEKNNIEDIFTRTLENDCTIDEIEKSYLNNELDNKTKIISFFTSNDEPVPAEEIRMKTSQPSVATQLQKEFKANGLILLDVRMIDENVKDMAQFFQTMLIIVSVVLGTLCASLLIAFVIKTRTLTNQLNTLSKTQFGSNASNLNRIGMPAPNTNLYAIEGSNPVWKEEVKPQDFDNISMGSGDSDMIGIENNKDFFDDNGHEASFNPVIQNGLGIKSGKNTEVIGPPVEFRPAFLH